MKKYLMKGFAAIVFCGAIASCSHDMDSGSDAVQSKVQETYEKAFVTRFGTPASTQTWGFGTSAKANTRAALPATPEFRDTNPIVKPELPTTFTFQNTVPENAKYAKDYQNYQKGDVIYINTEYQTLNQPQNTEDLTIYVDGNVTFCGGTNQGGNGTAFCVTENSTLTLGAVSNNLIVYLAPGATLDIRKGMQENITSYYPTYESEIVENGNNSFSFQNSHAAIYLSAGSKVKATDLTLISGAKLLNNGGTIEASNLTLDQQATLWNEGSIKVANTLTLTNTSSALYNKEGKKIETVNLDLINNDALLFNEGIVEATGDIVLHNTHAEIINYGELSGASFSSAAGGKMHNEGTGIVNITGKTDLTNSNSSWMNDGHWTCGSFDIDNYSHTNINNCHLTVNGQFHLNRGTFVLGANSGVVCNSFAWEDTSDFYLNSNSVLKVLGDLVTENANSGYGFRGIGDEYAVIEAASIKHNGNEQFRMSYYGKLFIATDNHFEQWYKDAPNTNQPSYWYESSVKFKFNGDKTTTIPETDCNPGYEGDVPPEEEVDEIVVLAEDLTIDDVKPDFDFNDVVFKVTQYKSGAKSGQVWVTLLAAGGTLHLTVDGHEVHEEFANANPDKTILVTTMINTARNGHTAYKTASFQVSNPSGSNIQEIANNIPVVVTKFGELIPLVAPTGGVPSKIAVKTDFLTDPNMGWCDERQDIDEKYNVQGTPLFKSYVRGELDDNWYTLITTKGNQ